MGSSASGVQRAYVLDDEEAVGVFVCRVLSLNGFAALHFTSAAPLLETITTEPPELLVLDLALGESDAVEVMQHLERFSYRGRVLLISGWDESTIEGVFNIGKSRGLAMLPPLSKPFSAEELRNSVLASVEVCVEAMDPPDRRTGVAISLAEALEEHWLELWYQPKIDVQSLALCGAEALIRARHPVHGVVGPVDFLPPPNDVLYHPLSALVLRRAMEDWAVFNGRGHPLELAVNIPVSVISEPGFVAFVRSCLPKNPSFRRLIIEVTENEILHDTNLLSEIASQLRIYNVFLSIDDFGSAYSTLSRVLVLPIAEIKLDRIFVSNSGNDARKGDVCQAVINLAHRFGAQVCAEGVETIEEFSALSRWGCDIAQGYLFAKPMPADLLLTEVLSPMSALHRQLRLIRQ